MRERAEWRGALSVMAAIAGVGLSSGRELVLFFAQMKDAAWIGVAAACALFGLLTAFVAAQGGNCPRRGGTERVREILRLLFAAVVSAFMLLRLGELGALTLPLRRGYLFGAGFGLLLALVLAWGKPGLPVTLGLAAFYCANAMDGRPPRVYLSGATEFALAGSTGAALALASVYAAMCGCASLWSLRRLREGTVRPAALGVKSAVLMALVLLPACAALLRGGDAVLVQPMPWVVLSARWGLEGFWLCAGLSALCAGATLSAALGFLLSRWRTEHRAAALFMLIGALAVFCVLSFGRI